MFYLPGQVRQTFLGLLFILTLWAAPGFAQQPSPTPKKNPFEGFHSSLDDRPGKPATGLGSNSFDPRPAGTPPAAASGGVKLDQRWDSPLGLASGGPKGQSMELQALLNGFAPPSQDTGAFPNKGIYGPLKYLCPLGWAQTSLGLAGKMSSGGKTAVVGFPDGLKFTEFTPEAGRDFSVRFLKDAGDQVVAVEFTAINPNALPRLPDHLPKGRILKGFVYDFVPEGVSAGYTDYLQVSFDLGDRALICTRGLPGRSQPPKSADLYIPKPMVGLILHCLSRP